MPAINLAQEMKAILTDYTDEVMHAVVDALEEVAEDSASKLHSAGDFKNRTGKYRKGWKAETEKKRTYASASVYNKTRYQLTHLLEYGHANRDGGRSKSFEHIATINEQAQEQAVKKIMEAIKGIK